MLLTKVKSTIRRFQMLDAGERVLVSVSGGPDSVCLLSVLHALSKDFNLALHVAHLDHMFRGGESAEEALFVANLARELGVPATVERIDVPEYCRERGLSAQAGAREARYAFLSRVAADVGAARIATGHTASDQAETFLMRLVRGAGVSGLSSIPPRRGNIIRPLIESTREDVLAYLNARDLRFASDPSNAKPLYTRNRIRLEALPVLKRFNPRIVEILAAEAALLRDEDEAVEAHLAAVADTAVMQEEDAVSVKRDVFVTLPPAFRRRLFRKIAALAGAELPALTFGDIDAALSFMLSAQTGRTMNLTPGLAVTREYNRFVFGAPPAPASFSRTLAVPGITVVEEPAMVVEIEVRGDGSRPFEFPSPHVPDYETAAREMDEEEQGSSGGNYRWQAEFDYDKIGPLLTLRSRRPGDRFCPAGMRGKKKKLQDFFVDEKVPGRKRDTVPLLCSGDEILWVMGLRTDERFLPGPETKHVLVVRVRNEDSWLRR
jgi:tRNA(Ile)-lysidine synthase